MLRLAIALACLAATAHADAPPSPRQLSGQVRPDDQLGAGSLVVRVVHDDFNDPKPPAKLPITLVAYAADERVTVITAKTDDKGRAVFQKLDTTGAVAYFALAVVPRAGKHDRLLSQPIVLGTATQVLLSGEKAASKLPAVDYDPKAPVLAPGKLRVVLEGVPEDSMQVEISDAASGKVVARGVAIGKALDVAMPRGEVFYATARGKRGAHRSRPFQPVADRGVTVAVQVYPRMMVRLQGSLEIDDQVLGTALAVDLQNHSWIPNQAPAALEHALPIGFEKAAIYKDDQQLATVTKTGIKLSRPLPPGGIRVRVGFNLPVTGGKARWELALPHGTFQSSLWVGRDPGVTVEAPSGVKPEATTHNGREVIMLREISVMPNRTMTFAVTPPKLSPKEKALRKACDAIQPERGHALIGKPIPPTVAPLVGGGTLDLAKLRGKFLLVNFNASFNTAFKAEPAKLAALAKQLRGVEVITLMSDADPKDVEKFLGKPGYRIALDPGVGEYALGPHAKAWGVPALPETFLVDKRGVVRAYFVNQREWDSAESIGCLTELMRD